MRNNRFILRDVSVRHHGLAGWRSSKSPFVVVVAAIDRTITLWAAIGLACERLA